MRADQFLRSLRESLPDAYPQDRMPRRGARAYWGADWTAWMTERLHDTADANGLSCCCKDDRHGAEFGSEVGQTRGYKRERLFDLTWYAPWVPFQLPEVIIEHENAHSWPAFLADHWKLMVGFAPLRVSFGYHKDPAALDLYTGRLNELAIKRGWRFPQDCEDLSLLGEVNMAPRGFRVLHRARGETRWEDLGRLDGAVRNLG